MESLLLDPVVVNQATKAATIPAGFLRPVTPPKIRQTLEWLATQQGVTSLNLILRIDRQLADWIQQMSPDDPRRLEAIERSARSRVDIVRGAVEYAIRAGSAWRDAITEFPSLHCCAVRGPVPALRRFVESKLFESDQSAVASVIVNEQIQVPEARHEAKDKYDADAQRREVSRILKESGDTSDGYLKTLRIGDFSGLWKQFDGTGQSICVLDSGADESHPALQRRLSAHAFFDAFGNYKEAKYAVDRGCHGTKITGLIAGRVAGREDLVIPGQGPLQLGLAPGAKIVSVNVLQGECRQERGTISQFLAGMDWAVKNQNHPAFGGYQVVNISIEIKSAFSPDVRDDIDALLSYMQSSGLVPILASGNHGGTVTQLGSKGTYIGACDSFGKPLKISGKCHVFAPGANILCCQPPVPNLGNDPLAVYTGTSLATAIVAGGVVLLCQASGRPAQECLAALIATRSKQTGVISLDKAYNYLVERY